MNRTKKQPRFHAEKKDIRKLIALGEIVEKTFGITDKEKIDSAKRKKFDSLIVSVTEELKNRDTRKAEQIVKSILTDVLLYHETRADFMIKNHLKSVSVRFKTTEH